MSLMTDTSHCEQATLQSAYVDWLPHAEAPPACVPAVRLHGIAHYTAEP